MVEKATETYKKIAVKDKGRRLKDAVFKEMIKPMTANRAVLVTANAPQGTTKYPIAAAPAPPISAPDPLQMYSTMAD